MTSLRISAPFLDMEWSPVESDKDAAWELYIELLTRIAIQPLREDTGDEEAALKSIYSLFGVTREIIKSHGRDCSEFTKIAIIVLNQVIRPFTSRWHKILTEDTLVQIKARDEFRKELAILQTDLKKYTKMLSQMAGVEDLTEIETT